MVQNDIMARVTAVQAKYVDELMNKKHVVGVGVGLAKKGGAMSEEMALVVMVEKKLPDDQLDPQDQIPRSLDGVRVDVQEVGTFVAF